MDAVRSKYHRTRYFYHAGREPDAYLEYDNAIYQGKVRAYWRGGLQIILNKFALKDQQTVLPRLTLGDPALGLVMNDMAIVEVKNFVKAGKISLTLEAPDQAGRELLDAHFRAMKGGYQVSKGMAADRLPGSTVKTHYSTAAVAQRRAWVENLTGTTLTTLSQSVFDPESLAGNIENYLGAVQIPVGIAGPVLVRGDYTDGFVPVPIATTEGALVRSISRGAKVCARAGGVQVSVRGQSMVRAPAFICDSMHGALNLERWILGHIREITQKAEQTSSVAVLRELKTYVYDHTLHLLFCYTTGDASGQNMTSSCTWNACEWIREQIVDFEGIGFQKYYIEGNMSGDKKLSHLNLSGQRGVSVIATCYIPDELLMRYLRVDSAMLAEYVQVAEISGLNLGIRGQNGNIANVIAGMFTATGQDIACVHESAVGIFKVRSDGRGLYCNMSLPGLVIGTVGGGTRLPPQRECLEMMGCHGNGHLFRFAEIIAATCLALDISTSAAIVSHDFVSAHNNLGRNRPGAGLTAAELNAAFLNDLALQGSQANLAAAGGRNIVALPAILHAREIPLLVNDGILSDIGQDRRKKPVIGLHRFTLRCAPTLDGTGPEERCVMLKIKDNDNELIATGTKLAMLAGDTRLAGLFASQSEIFNIEESHIRELMIYRDAHGTMQSLLPTCHGIRIDNKRKIYALLMQDLSHGHLLNSVNHPELWAEAHIELVLASMAQFHAQYLDHLGHLSHLGQSAALPPEWRVKRFDPGQNRRCLELLKELTQVNRENHPWFHHSNLPDEINTFLADIDGNSQRMAACWQTLTHNDFNPRNLCLEATCKEAGHYRLRLYDWELAIIQNPQRDLIEFLAYVLAPDTPAEVFFGYTECYRQQLQQSAGVAVPRAEFEQLLRLNAVWFGTVRLNLYLMAHGLLHFTYLERVCQTLAHFLGHIMPAPTLDQHDRIAP